MAILTDFITAFTLGMLTPLTAVCVLPLYPGFLVYLANQFKAKKETNKQTYAFLGMMIALGVIAFMLIIGIIFTTIFQVSLTNIIGIVSPIAFALLGIISLFLIFDIDFSRFMPHFGTHKAQGKNPYGNAFIYGFFFGGIVIPCNPAFIAALFARAALIQNPLTNIFNFLFFGLGIGFPLLAFSILSSKWSTNIIGFLALHKRKINLGAGIIMLGISIYYLFFVFRVFG